MADSATGSSSYPDEQRVVGWHLNQDVQCYCCPQPASCIVMYDDYGSTRDVCKDHLPATATDPIRDVFARLLGAK